MRYSLLVFDECSRLLDFHYSVRILVQCSKLLVFHILVQGYDTFLSPHDLIDTLERLFEPCGKLFDLEVSRHPTDRFVLFVFLTVQF